APAREVLEYEKHSFRSPVDENPFAGPPRPELDAAWHKLLKSIHTIGNERLRVIPLLLTPIETDVLIRLTDRSRYAASLEADHDLHCLVNIRHFIYRETYLPNITQADLEKQTFCIEHCLEHLRELVMCRGDVPLIAFLYRGGKKTAKLLAGHEYVDWNACSETEFQFRLAATVTAAVTLRTRTLHSMMCNITSERL
ncbi:hypothetical protein BDR22DRAFT_800779, partial [Usnea florida]